MIRVLYTVNGMRVNGVSSIIIQYIENLPKRKYEFTILTDEVAEEYRERLEKNRVKIIHSVNRKKNQVAYFMELIRIMKNEQYDIIHAHGNSATIAVELLAAKIAGISVRIAHSHNTTCTHKVIDKVLRGVLYRTYTVGIGCGEAAGKWLFHRHPHCVIKNGVDLQHFRYDDENRRKVRKQLGLENEYIIGHVGRFTNQKNHEAIIRIFTKFVKLNRSAKLLLVGNGPNEGLIRQLVEQMGLDEKVIFYGTTKDTAPLYSAMDVFLFPSKFEGVPLTLVEAQANGLHCFISDKISPEINITSLVHIMPLENESAWDSTLQIDTDLRNEDSEIGIQKLIENGFSLDLVIDQVDALYSSVTQGEA